MKGGRENKWFWDTKLWKAYQGLKCKHKVDKTLTGEAEVGGFYLYNTE